MSMEQNQLTRDLYAAGYTREDHPSFVYWSDWQNFGYLFEALLKFTWETPCGLLVDGKSDLGRGLACSDASFQGIDYCPENDNPLLRCPYERKDCPHSISGFPVPLCPCHTTGKRYSFEQSAEKVETERSERQHRQYMEITGGVYCACVVGCYGYEGGRVEVKYDVEQCIRCRCQNPVCVIRKQERDLSRANIFYDVRRTWITRIGFLEEKKVQVTKGERVFPHPVARTDAEIWLEMKKAHFNPLWSSSVIDSPHLTPEDRRQTFFSKMHRRYGEYDYFEFHYRGKYYTLTDQRIPYRRDKTEDERFFILTLFAIAHEIEAMGQYSGSLMRVQLAVGLPPAHFGVQARRFINYFNGRGAVAFQFKGKPYAIFIENTACFPQSFSAAAATVKNLASFPRALVVDIGGFTADYVRLRNGVPDMAACDSLENGVILLYNRICAKANAELDILLEESEIDRILRGEDQDAAPEVIALAEREAQEFINDLLSGLRERMLELKSGKVIFLGGGATLLRRQIEASGKIGQAIFVEDINANAKGYEYLYRLQHSGR